jgi:hypothetical protein
MLITTDRGQLLKIIEEPRWNDYHKRWYAAGYRFIKSRATFSGNCLLHNFKSFRKTEEAA